MIKKILKKLRQIFCWHEWKYIMDGRRCTKCWKMQKDIWGSE